ncbi:hypothetical protein D3C79_860180 [compost metagenome]
MTATDHREGFGGAENRRATAGGHGLFAGVDHVGIELRFGREFAHAQQAVFRLQHHVHIGRDVVGHQGRDADAEVDVVAVLEFAGYALGHLFAGKCHGQDLFVVLGSGQALTVRFSIRFSNVPTMTRST